MPKKIIRAAKSKAKDATAKVAPEINAADLWVKALNRADAFSQNVEELRSSGRDARIKAVDAVETKKDQIVESRFADVARTGAKSFQEKSSDFSNTARTATERAPETLAEATSNLADSEIGRRAQDGISAANESLRPVSDAVTKGVEITSDAWGQLNSSPLIVDAKSRIDTASSRIGEKIGRRSSELAAVAVTLNAVIDNLGGADIAGNLVPKFRSAGIRGEWRSPAEARAFFDSSVPDHVQMLGEDAVREFLAGKDFSHIESFKNNPGRVSDPTNGLWESASLNRSRGADDMTWLELAQVRFANGWEGFTMAAAEIVPRSMFYAAAIEAAISITENSIYVYRGGKEVPTALRDTAINVTKSAGMGLIIGTGIAALTAVGAAPAIVAIAPALGVLGGGLLIYSASRRIHTALTTPIYSGSEIIESQLVRCCPDDDERVPAAELVEMLEESAPELKPITQSA
jgi:hypothetical protein